MNEKMAAALAADISAVVLKENVGLTRYERVSKKAWKKIIVDGFGGVKIVSNNTPTITVFNTLEAWVLMFDRAPDITGNRLQKTATIQAGQLNIK